MTQYNLPRVHPARMNFILIGWIRICEFLLHMYLLLSYLVFQKGYLSIVSGMIK